MLPEILDLWGNNLFTDVNAKKQRNTEREMTTPLFMIRCVEAGISISYLDLLTIVVVLDMWIEKGNDSLDYPQVASQDDFDRF